MVSPRCLVVPYLSAVVYNPLSLQYERPTEISLAMPQVDVIMVPGTQIRATSGVDYWLQRDLPNHVALHWGYGFGTFTNKSAGCSILIRKRRFALSNITRVVIAGNSITKG